MARTAPKNGTRPIHEVRALRRSQGEKGRLQQSPGSDGFALALAVAVATILGIGAMALVIRSSSALLGSIRQQQSREALAAAEAGAEVIVRQLNTEYPDLLTLNCTPDPTSKICNWDGATKPKQACNSANGEQPDYSKIQRKGSPANPSEAIEEKWNNTSWELVEYSYRGDNYFGGSSSLIVQGIRYAPPNGSILATSRISEDFSIKFKECTPANSNSIGLLAQTMTIDKSSITALDINDDPQKGTTLCTGCDDLSDMSISGDIERANFLWGPRQIPPPPEPPSGLTSSLAPIIEPQAKGENLIYADQETDPQKGCFMTNEIINKKPKKVTHCRIAKNNPGFSIKLLGSENVRIVYPANNPSEYQVRLFLDGNILLGGSGTICRVLSSNPTLCIDNNLPTDSSAADLMLLGNKSCDSNQIFQLFGGTGSLSMFLYLPCGEVVPKGNATFTGAIWANKYTASPSGAFNIVIPYNFNKDIKGSLGSSIALMRPVAVGINRWASFENIP